MLIQFKAGRDIAKKRNYPLRFGKYLLLDRISTGGMAEVFLARSFGVEGFQKTVAIKKILPHISEDDNFVTMFIDEAKIVARLQHANICQVYEFGRISDDFYQVMEYISGVDMKFIARTFWSRNQQIPLGAAIHMIAKVCDGLDYAHSMKDRSGSPLNIVHRDVTPANILISFEGAVKLIDFGIAKATQRATKTQAGIVKGKFGYMTPEQLQGKEIDNRSDIFSLGVCLWELVAGRLLFNEPNDMDNLRRIINADYPNILDVRSDIPTELAEVIMKGLAYDRDERYNTAEEFGSELNRVAFQLGALWNTSKLQDFVLENFKEQAKANWDARKKHQHITEADFNSFPSIYDSVRAYIRDDGDPVSEVLELEDVEELDADDLFEEEISVEQDSTEVYRGKNKGSGEKENRTVSVSQQLRRNDPDFDSTRQAGHLEVSGSLDPGSFEGYGTGNSRAGMSESKVQFSEDDSEFLGESWDAYQSQDQQGFSDYNSQFDGPDYGTNERFSSNAYDYSAVDKNGGYGYNNGYDQGSQNYYDQSATWDRNAIQQGQQQGGYAQQGQQGQQQGGYAQQGQQGQQQGGYAQQGQQQGGYAQQQSQQGQQAQPQGGYAQDVTQQPQGYYADDGQWYPYEQQGYYGEDGQWYPYEQQQGYYGEDGQWYPYEQQGQYQQGYYGEDGQWYPYEQQGQYQQGYYGEDGQWYAYENQGQYQQGDQYQDYYNQYNNLNQDYNPDYGQQNPYQGNDPNDPKNSGRR